MRLDLNKTFIYFFQRKQTMFFCSKKRFFLSKFPSWLHEYWLLGAYFKIKRVELGVLSGGQSTTNHVFIMYRLYRYFDYKTSLYQIRFKQKKIYAVVTWVLVIPVECIGVNTILYSLPISYFKAFIFPHGLENGYYVDW